MSDWDIGFGGSDSPFLNDSVEFENFIEDQESVEELVNAPLGSGAMANSAPAMDAVVGSETAMDAVSASETAMDAVASSSTAMDVVAASSTARSAVRDSDLAFHTVAEVKMATAKFVTGAAGLDPTEYADMDAVVGSETTMDAVATSPLAITAFLASQHLMDVVYSSKENTNRLFSRPTTFTPTEGDWTETSNGWDGPDGDVEVRYGSNLSDSEGWFASGGYDDTPSEAESVIGFSPQGRDQGRHTLGFDIDLTAVNDLEFMYMHQDGRLNRSQEIIIDDDVVFNNEDTQDWTKGSVDLGDYSGEVTFEFGFGAGLDRDDDRAWCAFTAFEFN